MPVEILISSNFAEVAARFAAAAAEAPAEIEAGLAEAAAASRDVVVPILADNTPKRSGALAASSTGDLAVGGMEATITLRQPATSSDGLFYWVFPDQGRGPVEPINKKALAGPNFGPVRHAGPAPAQEYVAKALSAMEGPFGTVLEESGMEIAGKIVSAI